MAGVRTFALRRPMSRRSFQGTVAIVLAGVVTGVVLFVTSSQDGAAANRGHVTAADLAVARPAPLLGSRDHVNSARWWLLGTTKHDSVLVVAYELGSGSDRSRLDGFWVRQTNRIVKLAYRITAPPGVTYWHSADRVLGIATIDLHRALGNRRLVHD